MHWNLGKLILYDFNKIIWLNGMIPYSIWRSQLLLKDKEVLDGPTCIIFYVIMKGKLCFG